MIRFRPLPAMTVALVPAFLLLVALGGWQLARAEEKRLAIAAFDQRSDTVLGWAVVSQALCADRMGAIGLVTEPPATHDGPTVRFYGARGDGPPGWRGLQLVPMPACSSADEPRYVVAESAFETLRGEALGAPDALTVAEPARANLFTPANDAENATFFRFDPPALSGAFGVPAEHLVSDLWLVAQVEGLPPQLARTPPSRHIGYALTWFGLAAALIGVYAAYHLRAGRLGWAHPR